jgi:hypothetical protein
MIDGIKYKVVHHYSGRDFFWGTFKQCSNVYDSLVANGANPDSYGVKMV